MPGRLEAIGSAQDSGPAHEDNAPAKLAGVLRTANWFYTAPRQTGGGLRTAIGPASLAGQLAVRSTRAQH
jgi:hypothetical protein